VGEQAEFNYAPPDTMLAGDRTFPVSAARVWKELPAHFTSSHVFKAHLKTVLFCRTFPTAASQ